MTTITKTSRPAGLYDEQLQRQRQEKALFDNFGPGRGGGMLGRGVASPDTPPAENGGEK